MTQKHSIEYEKVSKFIKRSIDAGHLPGWTIDKIIKQKSEHGDDIVCKRESRGKGTRRKVLIEVKYGGDKFHNHFIDSLGELLCHMKNTSYYNEYGVAWHLDDKNKFMAKIRKMKGTWKKMGKFLNCRWVFFAGKGVCQMYSWAELLEGWR